MGIDYEALRATVQTTTVEIQTLAINGRGMTLAVYRQLPEAKLVTPEGEFAGKPWGTVNLCPSRDCPGNTYNGEYFGPEHRHVVWSDGKCLYRDVPEHPGKVEPYSGAADSWAILALAEKRKSVEWVHRDGGGFNSAATYCKVQFAAEYPALRCYLNEKSWSDHPLKPPKCNNYDCEGRRHDWRCPLGEWQNTEDAVQAAAAQVREHCKVANLDELSKLIAEDMRANVVRQTARLERWGEIVALPQLFLGV